MKELIQKRLKNREETIERRKESNALEMQALRDVKGKKSRQINQWRGPIKEATKSAHEEVAELFSMKKDIEDMKEELKERQLLEKTRTSTEHWTS